jgi:hypothetical protein
MKNDFLSFKSKREMEELYLKKKEKAKEIHKKIKEGKYKNLPNVIEEV